MFETIVVGTDASAGGDRAVTLSRSLVDPTNTNARVILVHVIEIVGGKGGRYPLAADEDSLEAKLRGQVAALTADGINAELQMPPLRIGGPAHVLADAAETAGADLIVVGSRGHSPLAQYLLGSVPLRLLHLARCPVIVVPAAQDEG